MRPSLTLGKAGEHFGGVDPHVSLSYMLKYLGRGDQHTVAFETSNAFLEALQKRITQMVNERKSGQEYFAERQI